MSLTEPSPDATPPRRPLPLWRGALAVGLGLAVWPAAWFGMYVHNSAPLAFICYHLVCALGAIVLRSPGLPAPHRLYTFDRRLLIGTVALANVVILGLYALVGAALLDRAHDLRLLASRGLPPSTYLFLFPYFALVNPIAEEFFWRGGVYATLRHFFRHWASAAAVASILFGGWHWLIVRLFVAPGVAIAITVGIMLTGFALSVLYERTRRLAYSVILHSLACDAPLLLLLLLLARG